MGDVANHRGWRPCFLSLPAFLLKLREADRAASESLWRSMIAN